MQYCFVIVVADFHLNYYCYYEFVHKVQQSTSTQANTYTTLYRKVRRYVFQFHKTRQATGAKAKTVDPH